VFVVLDVPSIYKLFETFVQDVEATVKMTVSATAVVSFHVASTFEIF
jgi:hypothetical protein